MTADSAVATARHRQSTNTDRTLSEFVAAVGASVPARARVLDAGAGECRFARHFAHTRYIATDLALGDATWDYSRLDVVSNLDHLPFRSGAFDVILLIEVLEHVPNPEAVLSELRRVAAPGARLFVTTPFLVGLHQEPYDYYRYTAHGLRRLAVESGFRVASVRPGGGYFTLLAILLDRVPNYLFPPRRRGWRRSLTLPLKAVARLFFSWIPALLLPPLDVLDTDSSHCRAYYSTFEAVQSLEAV
jgi:SAM-dependent methyltransferase